MVQVSGLYVDQKLCSKCVFIGVSGTRLRNLAPAIPHHVIECLPWGVVDLSPPAGGQISYWQLGWISIYVDWSYLTWRCPGIKDSTPWKRRGFIALGDHRHLLSAPWFYISDAICVTHLDYWHSARLQFCLWDAFASCLCIMSYAIN